MNYRCLVIFFAVLTALPQFTLAEESTPSAEYPNATRKVYQGYYTYEKAKGTYETCMKFKNTGTPYTEYLDDSLENNYQNFENMYLGNMNKTATCLNISDEERDKLRTRAENNYKDSDEAMMMKMGVAMVMSGQDNIKKFVDGCNHYSQSYAAIYSESVNETIDPVTCEPSKQ